jgi:ABC-type glycerol-3-phosphate transport system substrate-binding protein
LIKRDNWDKNQIFNSAYETMTWSGKVWAMMQHPDIVFNWISVSLMEQNGLNTRTMPATWAGAACMAAPLLPGPLVLPGGRKPGGPAGRASPT